MKNTHRHRTVNRSARLAGQSLAAALYALAPPVAAQADTELGTSDAVVVTGDSLMSRTESELVRPVRVIEDRELERRRAGTLGEVLDGLPGVANADFGPGVGRPVIRGLQGSRVEVLEDGLRTSDVSGEGVDHVVANDPLRARSVEFISGPATLMYGSGAAGGVVNVVTGRFSPRIGDAVSGSLLTSYTDNANERQLSTFVDAPLGEHFELRADYSGRRTSDYDIKGTQESDGGGRKGTLINSELESDTVSLSGMWSGQSGYLGLGYSHWRSDYGIPEPFDPRPEDEGGQSDEFERIDASYDRVDLRGELFDPLPGFRSARLSLAYTDFEQDEIETEFERTSDGGRFDERELEAAFLQDELDLRLEMIHEPTGGFEGTIGLDFNDVDFVGEDPDAGSNFFIRPVETQSLGLFAVEELPTDFGQLEFGARVGQQRARPEVVTDPQVESVDRGDGEVAFQQDPGTSHYDLVSASVGGRMDLGARHQLRGSFTYSQRAPSVEQLYAFGRHGASDTFEVGNPDLEKEHFHNAQLSLVQQGEPLRFEVTAFFNQVDDFVFFQFEPDEDGNPQRVDAEGNPDEDGELLVFNEQQDARFFGIELGAEADLVDAPVPVTARLNGDVLRGRLREGGNLPRMTPPRVGLGLDTQWQRFDLSLDLQQVFSQNRTGEAETRTSSYHLVGLDLGWRPADHEQLRVFARGRNLTNSDGRRHQSFFKESAPITGRALTAGLRYDL